MRSSIAVSLLVALVATQVAAVHCPAVGDIGVTEGAEGAHPAAQHHDHEPSGHPDPHGEHANEGHEHHGAQGCTMLLACGGAAVPRERPASRGADGPEISSELPTLRELRSTPLSTDPPPPKPRA